MYILDRQIKALKDVIKRVEEKSTDKVYVNDFIKSTSDYNIVSMSHNNGDFIQIFTELGFYRLNNINSTYEYIKNHTIDITVSKVNDLIDTENKLLDSGFISLDGIFDIIPVEKQLEAIKRLLIKLEALREAREILTDTDKNGDYTIIDISLIHDTIKLLEYLKNDMVKNNGLYDRIDSILDRLK